MNEGILSVAAELAALGVNPLPFLTTRDDVIRSFYMTLQKELSEIKDIQARNLAVYIADEVVKRFK